MQKKNQAREWILTVHQTEQEQEPIAWYYLATIMGMLENVILFLYDEQTDSWYMNAPWFKIVSDKISWLTEFV